MSEVKFPYDQQEIYQKGIVFFAKLNVPHYQVVTEPNLYPNSYGLFVPKEQLDEAQEKVADLEKALNKKGARKACFDGAKCELVECQICGCDIHLDEPEELPVCEECFSSPQALESCENQIEQLKAANQKLREALIAAKQTIDLHGMDSFNRKGNKTIDKINDALKDRGDS